MRILILSVSAIALSGCSWLGLGNNTDYRNYNYQQNSGSYGYKTNKTRSSNGCHSGQCLARWNIEAAVGPTFNVGGDFITGDEAHPNSNVAVNNISFSEAYNEGIRGELGGSYALSPNRKVTGNVFYEHAESEGVLDLGVIGGTTDPRSLTGEFSDYQSYGAEIGLRQYFAPRRFGGIIGNIRPYVEGKIGATHLDDISLQGATVGTNPLAADIPFYRSGWVGSAAGLAGVETPIARHTTLALESGVRYTQGPRTDTTVLSAGSPLAGINNGGGRVSIPFMLRGRYRF